ncbi:sensor histidine kinase [Cyanobium sp. FACHB-13342]|uniref:sensor histidine kinase n=1 Tax=Cyanobium sp. FACHB-13342 TaxID=2692793 RepID=UPI001681BC49|nr:sensor histidine kinase [Cyanobium sp. FACHB-13342]MBD2421930.1 sensor histidine kinase [Cyanobium sp. FACHB-13342]
MPPDPLQLRRRLALQGGGFALLLLAAFSGSLYWGIASQRQQDQRTELRQLAGSAAAQLPLIAHETREAEGRAKFRAGPRLIDSPTLQQQRLQWFDAQGALLSEQGGLTVPSLSGQPAGALASARGIRVPSRALWQRWPGGMSLWQPVDSQAERLGYVRVALSDQAARADLSRLKRGLLLGGVVTVLAALLVGRRMLRMAFLPLQRQVSALQRFTADASHELRHPLTALRTQLAAVPPELRQQPALAWGELDGLSRRMGELLDDLLLLARQEQAGLDGPLSTAELQEFDLLELLEDLLRCYAPQAAARSVRLQLSPDPATQSVPFRGQSEPLLRLFTNLLLNAIRHSPEGGTVSLQVSRAGRLIRVTVADQGPGIPLQEREQVFERFWSGTDRGGHSGLGLAIGRAIARRHGGELRIGESRTGRCELVVELPPTDAL